MEHTAPAIVHIARNFGETPELALWERYAVDEGQHVINLCPGRQRGINRFTDVGGSILTMRRRLRRAQQDLPGHRYHIYHQGWGLDAVVPADKATRRFVLFHEPFPLFERLVVHLLRFSEGVIVPTDGMKTRIEEAAPWIPESRIHVMAHPCEQIGQPGGDLARVPGLTGFPGRIEFRGKRVDRIPRFLEAPEFAGDPPLELFPVGNDLRLFRRKWRRKSQVRFREERALPDRMARMRAWDVALYLSSYEGLPQSLAWAVMAGVLPLFPVGDGIEPPFPLHRACVYEAAETEEALTKYRALCGLSAQARDKVARANRAGLDRVVPTSDALAQFLEREIQRRSRTASQAPKAAFGPAWPIRIYSYFIQFARTGQWGSQRFMHEPGSWRPGP